LTLNLLIDDITKLGRRSFFTISSSCTRMGYC